MLHQMLEPDKKNEKEAVDRAIALVETALADCDEHGFLFVGIDLSSALDKLYAMQEQLTAR